MLSVVLTGLFLIFQNSALENPGDTSSDKKNNKKPDKKHLRRSSDGNNSSATGIDDSHNSSKSNDTHKLTIANKASRSFTDAHINPYNSDRLATTTSTNNKQTSKQTNDNGNEKNAVRPGRSATIASPRDSPSRDLQKMVSASKVGNLLVNHLLVFVCLCSLVDCL